MSETCAPPPEHRDKPWHWLRHPAGKVIPVEWEPAEGLWWRSGVNDSGDDMHARGWRYVGPAIPPASEPA